MTPPHRVCIFRRTLFWQRIGSAPRAGNQNGVETALCSPASGHQRHGWHGENRGVGGDFYSCGAEVALRNPPDVSPERPGLRAVCGVLSPPWLFRMAWGLWGLCPQGSLLVFGAAFVFGTEAGVQLSPVFVPAGALGHGIRIIPATLGLGRPVWPVVMILGIKSSSLAGRPILPRKKKKERD